MEGKTGYGTFRSSDEIYYPEENANVFQLTHLLSLAGIDKFEEVQKKGATLLLTSIWDCDLDSDKCDSVMNVRRLDSKF